MRVRELIEKLSKVNPELPVVLIVEHYGDLAKVRISDHSDWSTIEGPKTLLLEAE